MYAIPSQRSAPAPADDTYTASFNAQLRCSAAQRAERRIAFARAQRDRVIASLLLCPERDQAS
jgi:hypothetical protein